MKVRTQDVLAYGAFFAGAVLVGGCILAGDFSRYQKAQLTSIDPADEKKLRASFYEYAKQLETSGNPRDLAVSAFLQVSNHPDRELGTAFAPSAGNIALLKKALTHGQDDATLAWLEALDCGWMTDACDKDAGLARLLKLQPENAAVDFFQFNEAHWAGNTEAAWKALANGGNKKYFSLPIDAIGTMYFESLQNWRSPITMNPRFVFGENAKNIDPLTQDEYRKIEAFGYSIALAIPALQHYSEYCKPAPADPGKLLACQKFTTLFATGNTRLSRGLDTNIALSVFTQSPEKEKWQALRTQYQWQFQQYSKLLALDYSIERKYLQQWPGMTEQARLELLLRDNGIALIPPADWSLPEQK